MSPQIKKAILAILFLAIFAGVGYYLSSSGTDVSSLLTPEESGPVGQDILSLVDKLKTVSIDSTLLSSTLFTNLRDYSSPLSPQSQGRTNPFLTIGVDSSAAR